MGVKDNTGGIADFGAGDHLVEGLKGYGIVSEIEIADITSVVLMEASQNTPTLFISKGVPISWELFYSVYSDPDRYPTVVDVFRAFGRPPEDFGAVKDQTGNMNKTISRIRQHFLDSNREARELGLPTFNGRSSEYSRLRPRRGDNRDEYEDDIDAYTGGRTYEGRRRMSDIDPGRRGRKTRTSRMVEKINAQEILPGEFYSDATRIAKRSWGGWLRGKTHVPMKLSLIGRSWRKTFVIGYRVDNTLLYEVWYNSLDSTFTIHDFRGNPAAAGVPTMAEAIKQMLAAVAHSSARDGEIFANGGSMALASSVFRAMTNSLDSRIDDLRDIEKKEAEKKKASLDSARRRDRAKVMARRKIVGNIASGAKSTAKGAGNLAIATSKAARDGVVAAGQYSRVAARSTAKRGGEASEAAADVLSKTFDDIVNEPLRAQRERYERTVGDEGNYVPTSMDISAAIGRLHDMVPDEELRIRLKTLLTKLRNGDVDYDSFINTVMGILGLDDNADDAHIASTAKKGGVRIKPFMDRVVAKYYETRDHSWPEDTEAMNRKERRKEAISRAGVEIDASEKRNREQAKAREARLRHDAEAKKLEKIEDHIKNIEYYHDLVRKSAAKTHDLLMGTKLNDLTYSEIERQVDTATVAYKDAQHIYDEIDRVVKGIDDSYQDVISRAEAQASEARRMLGKISKNLRKAVNSKNGFATKVAEREAEAERKRSRELTKELQRKERELEDAALEFVRNQEQAAAEDRENTEKLQAELQALQAARDAEQQDARKAPATPSRRGRKKATKSNVAAAANRAANPPKTGGDKGLEALLRGRTKTTESEFLNKDPEAMFMTEWAGGANDVDEDQMRALAVSDAIKDPAHKRTVTFYRDSPESQTITARVFKDTVNSDLISSYDKTRAPSGFLFRLGRLLSTNRKDRIVRPNDKPGIFKRTMMSIVGARHSADFIAGFSLHDAVNIEVWYIVEPNPSYSYAPFASNVGIEPTISYFAVFDVSSGRLLRKYIPYFRNAIQIAMSKISAR